MNSRPTWDEYFMAQAVLASVRSTCLSRRVGALIVRESRLIAGGYNGSPPGMPHCTEVGCLSLPPDQCVRTIHAEQNAIIQAALYGVSTQGATLYTTCRPCHVCSRMVAGAGIVRVVFLGEEPEGWSLEVFQSCGIQMTRVFDYQLARLDNKLSP